MIKIKKLFYLKIVQLNGYLSIMPKSKNETHSEFPEEFLLLSKINEIFYKFDSILLFFNFEREGFLILEKRIEEILNEFSTIKEFFLNTVYFDEVSFDKAFDNMKIKLQNKLENKITLNIQNKKYYIVGETALYTEEAMLQDKRSSYKTLNKDFINNKFNEFGILKTEKLIKTLVGLLNDNLIDQDTLLYFTRQMKDIKVSIIG